MAHPKLFIPAWKARAAAEAQAAADAKAKCAKKRKPRAPRKALVDEMRHPDT